MRTFLRAAAAAAALFAGGCASSDWAKTENVPGGTLYVPKVYAPLLPGSIYPDKKVPVPAKSRPAIVVVCPKNGDCRKKEILGQAAQRGLVVLVGSGENSDLLRTRADARSTHIGWLFVQPEEDLLGRWTSVGAPGDVIAVIGPPPRSVAPSSSPSPSPSSPSKKILLLSALLSDDPPEAEHGMILKLYSPGKKNLLPSEAFRDAVEWLALELASR